MALAATALTGARFDDPSAAVAPVQQDVRFFNASPYQMVIAGVGDPNDPYADLANPIAPVINPGQSFTMSKDEVTRFGTAPTHFSNSHLDVIEVDQDSGVMDLDAIQLSGYQPGVNDCAPMPGRSMAPRMNCVIQVPDTQAGETGPMQVSIWTTNPQHYGHATTLNANAGDKASIGNFLDAIALMHQSWVSFQPDLNTVSWGNGESAQAGQAAWNCTTADVNEQIGGAATHDESTNIAGTFGKSHDLKLFSAINASMTTGQPWTTSTSDSYGVSEDIASYNVGWLASIPATETVSGSVTATTSAGYPVVISNISFTEPGVDQTNNPALNFEYVPHSRAMTPEEIATYCGSSPPGDTVNHDGIVIGGSVS